MSQSCNKSEMQNRQIQAAEQDSILMQAYLKSLLRTVMLRSHLVHQTFIEHFSRFLIHTAHRLLAEKFFYEVVEAVRDDSSSLCIWIISSPSIDKTAKSICKELQAPALRIKMTQIDYLLSIPDFRKEAYNSLKIIETDLPYPVSEDKSHYLYGFLSETIHCPDSRVLWLRENENPDFKKYASYLATRYSVKVDSFDAEHVALGMELVEIDSMRMPPSDPSLGSSGKSQSSTLPDALDLRDRDCNEED